MLIKFESFELDIAARCLRQEGKPIPLNSKTFDVLLYLAEHPRQVVTKEELLSAVWNGAFVEEGNLSQHVFLMRKALAAVGVAKQIVVTVPGKGYQFTASIERVSVPPPTAMENLIAESTVDALSTEVARKEPTENGEPTEFGRITGEIGLHKLLIWLFAVIISALMAGGSYLAWKHWRRTAQHIDIVLADMENTTGDPAFDRVLNQALLIDLQQSPFLNFLPQAKIQQTFKEMQRKSDEALTPNLAREICERNNNQAILRGSISKFGSKYLLVLNADSCVDGKNIVGFKTEADSKEAVLQALDSAAGKLREKLGESAASLEHFHIPIERATTSSLEALRAFTRGNESYTRGDMKGALTLYQEAVALDPNFASAYKTIGACYYNLFEKSQASIFVKKAFDLRDRTTEYEKMKIEIAYYYFGNSDLEAAARSLKLYLQTYPNDGNSYANLCNLYTQLGDYPAAIQVGEQALRLDPHSGLAAEVLARAYKRANRYADAKRVANASIANGSDRWGTHSILFQVAYGEGDVAKMKSEGEWALLHHPGSTSLFNLAFAAATSGKVREAKEDFTRGYFQAMRDGDTEFANTTSLAMADVLVFFEEKAQAIESIKKIKGDASGSADQAFIDAVTGNLASANRFVAASDPLTEKDTLHIYVDLPRVRAQLALEAHKPLEAIQLLEPARAYQFVDFTILSQRAQAETEAGQLNAAAEDYRLILNNQGIDPISPLYSIAHLRLARLLALQKKSEEAREEYRRLFVAWTNADSDLPLLQAARHEYEILPK